MAKQSIYLRLETRIASGSLTDVVHRWRYGRALLAERAGRKKLPDGKIEGLIKAAADAGLKVSRREIQYRLKSAEVYGSEAQLRTAACAIGSWTDLRDAGFPAAESTEPDDIEAAGIPIGAPDEFEQLTLIPGAPPVLSIRGRRVELTNATLGDFKAYCEQSAEITANFAKRDTQLWAAYRTMLDVTDDPDANALDAWKRGTES